MRQCLTIILLHPRLIFLYKFATNITSKLHYTRCTCKLASNSGKSTKNIFLVKIQKVLTRILRNNSRHTEKHCSRRSSFDISPNMGLLAQSSFNFRNQIDFWLQQNCNFGNILQAYLTYRYYDESNIYNYALFWGFYLIG